jgi:hypothetical protein
MFEPRRRSRSELPLPDKGKDPVGRKSYEKHLDGQPARLALEEIERMLTARSGST